MKLCDFFTVKKPLILASASPQRAEILKRFGVSFCAVPADIVEDFLPHEKPSAVACALALKKALAVAKNFPKSVVLGVDTLVVSAQGEILGKPQNEAAARRMIAAKSASAEIVISGVALVQGEKTFVMSEKGKVFFGEITLKDLEEIIAFNEWQGRSGAFSVEGKTGLYIEKIVGCYWNIVGLPIYRLRVMLEEFLA